MFYLLIIDNFNKQLMVKIVCFCCYLFVSIYNVL